MEMGVLAGPYHNLEEILAITPPEDSYNRTAYVVKTTRAKNNEEDPIEEPVARWKNGHWQRKKIK
jgi:hypothetical protein